MSAPRASTKTPCSGETCSDVLHSDIIRFLIMCMSVSSICQYLPATRSATYAPSNCAAMLRTTDTAPTSFCKSPISVTDGFPLTPCMMTPWTAMDMNSIVTATSGPSAPAHWPTSAMVSTSSLQAASAKAAINSVRIVQRATSTRPTALAPTIARK